MSKKKFLDIMSPTVIDPLDLKSRNDFFCTQLHNRATSAVQSTWWMGSRYSIRTEVPLMGCEPLIGLKSLTCDEFTAFAIKFRTLWPLTAETDLAKYTNGSTALSSRILSNDGFRINLHAKSPGFLPTTSGRVDLEKIFANNTLTVYGSLESDSLEESSRPIPTIGVSWMFAKHLYLIAQKSALWGVGLKFQPCGHMHAGLGMTLSHKGALESVESSVYAETHSGATIAVLGRYKPVLPSNIQVLFTQPIGQKYESTAVDPSGKSEGKVVVPQPQLGLMYDFMAEKMGAFIDFGIGAQTSSLSMMNLGVKLGFEWTKNEPRFGIHLTAQESEKQ